MKTVTFIKRTAAVLCAFALCILSCGCGIINVSISQTGKVVDVFENSSEKTTYEYLPCKRKDGGKFKIAWVDIDPYPETFRMVYYVIEQLKKSGWISYDSLPFDPDDDSDTLKMLDWVADNAESEYMEFDKEIMFYTSETPENEIYSVLQQHIEVLKDVDAILALGTTPAKMMEKFGFDIPLLMYGVSDAVGSGLIKSAEDSGNENYWAHVDPSVYARQLQYYYNLLGFSNLGTVYGDEAVGGIPEYRSVAKENGFKLTEYVLDRETTDEDEYYTELKKIYSMMIEKDKTDAYIINTNVFTSEQTAKEFMQMFFDAGIPVLTQIGPGYVKEGASLMIVDPRDADAAASYVAYVIGAVFNGTKPGDLDQIYASTSYLVLNMSVADRINYHPSFEMFLACDDIIS